MSAMQPYTHECGQTYLRRPSGRSFLRRLNAICDRCQSIMPVHDETGRLYLYLPIADAPVAKPGAS